MPFQFLDGKLLFVGDQIALDSSCCCGNSSLNSCGLGGQPLYLTFDDGSSHTVTLTPLTTYEWAFSGNVGGTDYQFYVLVLNLTMWQLYAQQGPSTSDINVQTVNCGPPFSQAFSIAFLTSCVVHKP